MKSRDKQGFYVLEKLVFHFSKAIILFLLLPCLLHSQIYLSKDARIYDKGNTLKISKNDNEKIKGEIYIVRGTPTSGLEDRSGTVISAVKEDSKPIHARKKVYKPNLAKNVNFQREPVKQSSAVYKSLTDQSRSSFSIGNTNSSVTAPGFSYENLLIVLISLSVFIFCSVREAKFYTKHGKVLFNLSLYKIGRAPPF